MKKTAFTIICFLILSWPAEARREEPLANANRTGLSARSIEQVLRLREDEVDLATAALIVSGNWSDIVYGRRYLSTLDDMALEIRRRLRQKNLQTNYQAIPVINEYLFNELGFEPLSEASDPNSLFLHTVLDKKRGYCLSLSVLYLSLAERLGISIYGVVVPGHFFVRYDDERVRFNIETTSKGASGSDEQYIEKFKVPQGNNSSIYMKNLSKIQTLGCFLNNLGNSYSDIGDYDSALKVLQRAVEINPTLSESRANLGNIYLRNGRINDAVNEYLAALRINPNDAKTHNNIGNAYSEQGRLNYAVSEYQRAINQDPNFIDAYRNLAIVYCKQERFTIAIARLRQALSLDPKDAACYSQLGEIYSRMGSYKQAISQYERALKFQPELIEAHHGLAFCYNKLGLLDEEILAYKSILALKPDEYAALVNLGNAYFEQDKYEEAILLYRKAIQIQPEEASLYYNLGAAYSNNRNYQQAVVQYLRVIEIDPTNGEAHYGLAFGYYQLKQYDLAWRYLKRAQELGVEVGQDQLDAIKRNL